jgi:hypothetical protein
MESPCLVNSLSAKSRSFAARCRGPGHSVAKRAPYRNIALDRIHRLITGRAAGAPSRLRNAMPPATPTPKT